MLNVRFWKVLRLWTTVCCWGSTTRPKQSESASLWAHLQEEGMKRGAQLREPCIQLRWSLYREAPHAGTHWTTMTRKSLFCAVCSYHLITFTSDGNVFPSVCSMGGIPAVGVKGERLLLFVGIIDILQSYRWATKHSGVNSQRTDWGSSLNCSSLATVICPIASSNSQRRW